MTLKHYTIKHCDRGCLRGNYHYLVYDNEHMHDIMWGTWKECIDFVIYEIRTSPKEIA